jgi:predicted nucleic acid-binding protein
VRYLLDVNVLLALGSLRHEFHERVADWERRLALSGVPEFVTCSTTELGFVRILAQVPAYGFTVAQARKLLLALKSAESVSFTFLPDDQDISQLPGWVLTPNQTTDGHLVQLANASGVSFATLDGRIPGAYLIPA